jgi:hypothetical protein
MAAVDRHPVGEACLGDEVRDAVRVTVEGGAADEAGVEDEALVDARTVEVGAPDRFGVLVRQ